jgi:hypothetical protein
MTATLAILFGAALIAAVPRPIEISNEGKTPEGQKIAEGVRLAFAHSPHFVLSSGHKLQTLYVYVPAKIGTRKTGTRTEYFARLLISEAAPDAPERLSSAVHAHCPENDLAACGRDAVAEAERF